MKIRNGFVSNSSSSSFIVAFKKVPKSVAEMQKMLFGDEPYYKNPYYYPEDKEYGSEPSWYAEEVSARVFKDMKNIVPPEEIEEELKNGYIVDDFAPEYNDFSSSTIGDDWEKRHDKWRKAMEKYAESVAKDFIKDNPEATFYIFTYSDNDGPLHTALEHGNLFNKLPHVKVGNH